MLPSRAQATISSSSSGPGSHLSPQSERSSLYANQSVDSISSKALGMVDSGYQASSVTQISSDRGLNVQTVSSHKVLNFHSGIPYSSSLIPADSGTDKIAVILDLDMDMADAGPVLESISNSSQRLGMQSRNPSLGYGPTSRRGSRSLLPALSLNTTALHSIPGRGPSEPQIVSSNQYISSSPALISNTQFQPNQASNLNSKKRTRTHSPDPSESLGNIPASNVKPPFFNAKRPKLLHRGFESSWNATDDSMFPTGVRSSMLQHATSVEYEQITYAFEFPSISAHNSGENSPAGSDFYGDGNNRNNYTYSSCESSPLELPNLFNGCKYTQFIDSKLDEQNKSVEPRADTDTGIETEESGELISLPQICWADCNVYIEWRENDEPSYPSGNLLVPPSKSKSMGIKWALRMDAAEHDGDTLNSKFRGLDVNSIFPQVMSIDEIWDSIWTWNNKVKVSMQRYHLPMVGKMLSSRDQTFLFHQIPAAQYILDTMSKVIFGRHLVTPAASLSPMPSSPLRSNSWNLNYPEQPHSPQGPIESSRDRQIKVSPEVFECLDFALACSLIGHWVGSRPSHNNEKRTEIPEVSLDELRKAHEKYAAERSEFVDEDRGVIKNPCKIYPRRLWDLKTNRVIPTFLFHLPWFSSQARFPEYIAISHSWVHESRLTYIETPINQGAWPVPLPKGINLDCIRNEILGYFPSTRYCWLDVLCLRQTLPETKKGSFLKPSEAYKISDSKYLDYFELAKYDCGGSKEVDAEKRIDVPTIGYIYQNAKGVLRYFNGLGKAFKPNNWENKHHWLNRAWTLQESVGISVNGGTGERGSPSDAESVWRGQTKPLREILDNIKQMMEGLQSGKVGIMLLGNEMAKRYSTDIRGQEVDKIAGLSYLLRFHELPVYSKLETEAQAWKRCLNSAPPAILAELFFNSPFGSLFGLFPSWKELLTCPETASLLSLPSPSTLDIVDGYRGFIPDTSIGELKFFGYQLIGEIIESFPNSGNYRVIARGKANVNPRVPKFNVNLNFFSGRRGEHLKTMNEAISSNPKQTFKLFTHDITPGVRSSWVVILNGKKIGNLYADQFLTDFHCGQVLWKGYLTNRSQDENKLRFVEKVR